MNELDTWWGAEEFCNMFKVVDGELQLSHRGEEEYLNNPDDAINHYYVDYAIQIDFIPKISEKAKNSMVYWQDTQIEVEPTEIRLQQSYEVSDYLLSADALDEARATIDSLKNGQYYVSSTGSAEIEYLVECPGCRDVKSLPTRQVGSSYEHRLRAQPLPVDENHCPTCNAQFETPTIPGCFTFEKRYVFNKPFESPMELMTRLNNIIVKETNR